MDKRTRILRTLAIKGYTDEEALAYLNTALGESNPVPYGFDKIHHALSARWAALRSNNDQDVKFWDNQLCIVRNK